MASGRPEALDRCPWLCAAPQGPDTPFDWPVFFVVDSLRVLITVGAVLLIAVSVSAILKSPSHGQKCRFGGGIGAYLYMFGTELSHLGDLPHWRFIVGIAAVPLLLWGYYQHLYREFPARDKPHGQDPPT